MYQDVEKYFFSPFYFIRRTHFTRIEIAKFQVPGRCIFFLYACVIFSIRRAYVGERVRLRFLQYVVLFPFMFFFLLTTLCRVRPTQEKNEHDRTKYIQENFFSMVYVPTGNPQGNDRHGTSAVWVSIIFQLASRVYGEGFSYPRCNWTWLWPFAHTASIATTDEIQPADPIYIYN